MSKKYFRELEQQRDDKLNAELEGRTVFQRFNILTKKMIAYKLMMKQREYRRHSQTILIDMTQQEYGIPKISFIPKGKQTLAYPYKIRVHVKTNFEGKDFLSDIGGVDITQKTRNLW